MKRKLNLLLMLLLVSLTSMAADDMNQFVPSNFGGWQNLSASVNDITYYTSDPLPMQAAVSGKTVHVFWVDWKPNAQGNYCVFYRRSTDAGKTWEAARTIVASKDLNLVDINYVGGSFGSNAKWFNVEGQNVQVVTVVKSEDGNNSELLFTYSTDGGQTFQQRILATGSTGDGHFYYGRPHVVSDGQTLVVAFQNSRYNGSSYKTRVLTSFDGGASFTDKEIDMVQNLADLQVSGKRWAVLGEDDDWNNGMLRGNVYLSISDDGGETITTQNVAPVVNDREREGWDDRSWGSLEFMKGHNGDSYNYHPLMTLEGDVINVVFRGCAEEVEGKRPTNDRNHTIFRRSTDGGKTWTKAIYLPKSNGSNCTIAAKGEHIYVLETVNGPLMSYSNDGGQTWNVQNRGYWDSSSDRYANFYELYIAPDDASGQHVYMTGCRGLLVESKDGFRTVERNFSIGTESWYGGRSNNHSLTVLLDSEGTEHWLMNYQAPYKNFDSYFWNIVYRRNDPLPATTGKEMALDISKKVYAELTGRIVNNVTIPMTPSIMATQEATTVECWVRVDETDNSFEIASLTNNRANHEGSVYQGGWFIHTNVKSGEYTFYGGLTTELSVDGRGKEVGDYWCYHIKDKGFWHHVALTYDSNQEKDNIRFYIDGALINTATEKGKILMGSNPIVIGRTTTYGDNQKAKVDNFAIWSRALTQEEIQAHIYNKPDATDKDCRLLLTFDGSLQDQSQYHNDPVPLMEATLEEHDGIRPPHPDFTMSTEMNGQKVYVNDVTKDGEGVWWILPYPGKTNDYKTSDKRHVEQNFSGYPGNYRYTLLARGTGNFNAYASASKDIIVGGLSRVTPDVAGQAEGVKLRIQGGYKLTYSSQPKVVLKQGDTEIEGQWEVEYGYDKSNSTSIDDLAPASFNLSSAPTGKYDVIVGTDTLYQAFTVEKAEEPDVWVQVNGFGRSLWNKYQRYTIDYGNRSNVAAYNTPLFIVIPDRHGTIDVQFEFDFNICDISVDNTYQKMTGNLGDYLMAYDEVTQDSVRIYSFMVPYIGPNSTEQRSFRIKMTKGDSEPSNEIKIGYWVEQPWGPYDAKAALTRAPFTLEQGECFAKELGKAAFETAISFIPGASCLWSIGKNGYDTVVNGAGGSWTTLFTNTLDVVMNCAEEAIPGAHAAQAAWKLASTAWDLYSKYDQLKSMHGCLHGDPNAIGNKGVGSYDPNEMIGPAGYDDNAHYIKPIHNMAYTITYENKASATAPAHEVFINDKLDASKYDFSTFGFSSFGWAGQQWSVGGSMTKAFTRDIPYTVNGTEILVRVSGAFDEKTGEVNWSMVSLKKNGDEIEDPDLGYLLPNNDNGDGEGFVSFYIEHKANPANGSTISNKAVIVFDANDPIETNTFVNTFDTDYPTSKAVKVEQSGSNLVLTFEGSDATSGIAGCNIYVFKNGGEAELTGTLVTGNSFSIPYDESVNYAFCTLAVDNVGWKEAKDIKPEIEYVSSGINSILFDDMGSWTIYSVDGKRVAQGKGQKQLSLPAGVYVIQYGKTTRKVWINK